MTELHHRYRCALNCSLQVMTEQGSNLPLRQSPASRTRSCNASSSMKLNGTPSIELSAMRSGLTAQSPDAALGND